MLTEYVQSFQERLHAYESLQAAEGAIVKETMMAIATRHPEVFGQGGEALKGKWKNDTTRVLRYTAVAMLMNDPETVRERFLLWFQTIMRAFGTQKSCDITYNVLQDVVAKNLDADAAALFQPYMEMNRQVLGQSV